MTDDPTSNLSYSDRGFAHFDYIDLGGIQGEDHRVRVYESSIVDDPKIWLQVVDETGAAYAHMTIDQARLLASQLVWLADHHYQTTGASR